MGKEKNHKDKRGILFIAVLICLMLFSITFVSSYSVSYPSQANNYDGTDFGSSFRDFDTEKYCRQGNDFIFQIKPFSCTPKVVRSDLLEDQDVPVFCTVSATQLNPLLDVKGIERLSFSGETPGGVKTLGFQPNKGALGSKVDMNSPIMDDIGSVVIVLNRERNESAMPNAVEGNITANIRYDVEETFGIGKSEFYLPAMDNNEWSENQKYYSFWDGKGYLRAENIYDDRAKISIYSDKYRRGFGSSELEKIRSFSQTLSVGDSSGEIFLPGFNPCMANLQVQLRGVEDPDTTVRLRVNADMMELKQGEEFLDEKCSVRGIEKYGLTNKVKLRCEEDEGGLLGRSRFELVQSPRINLEIDGENKTYETGDRLYQTSEGSVYLGYIGSENEFTTSPGKEELYVYTVFLAEEDKEELSREEVVSLAKNLDRINAPEKEGQGKVERIADILRGTSGNLVKTWNWFKKGEEAEIIPYKTSEGDRSKKFKDREISIVDFADAINEDFSSAFVDESEKEKFEEYYENAMDDYDTLEQGYKNEEFQKKTQEDSSTYGKEALKEKIKLAGNTGQKKDMKEFCLELEEKYPEMYDTVEECESKYLFSNTRVSGKDVLINGRVRRISLDGVKEPTYEDYGAEITIINNNKDGKRELKQLRKDERIYVGEDGGEFIQLVKVDKEDEEVKIRVNLDKRGDEQGSAGGVKTLSMDDSETFFSNYEFILQEINHKKVAHVNLKPDIDMSRSTADFNFRVDIEKRAFKMSPEKTEEMAKKMNKTVEKLEEITSYLDDATQVMKGACQITRAGLTIKSFIENANGKGEARTKVMKGKGGWNEYCSEKVELERYDSQEQCFNANADNISRDVDRYTEIMNKQDEKLKDLQEKHMEETELLNEKFVDTEGFAKDYAGEVSSEVSDLDDKYFTNPENPDEKISKETIQEVLENQESWDNNQYTVEELKRIEMYSESLKENPNDEIAQKELFSVLSDINENSKDFVKSSTNAEEMGIRVSDIHSFDPGESMEEREYRGRTAKDINVELQGVNENTPIEVMQNKQEGFKTYILVLNDTVRRDVYTLANEDGRLQVYDSNGNLMSEQEIPEDITNTYFKKYDKEDYENNYNNPEIKYYESGNYEGLPAIVPFDTDEGWYAAVEKSMALGDVTRGYDESGRVNSFWVCNVGDNGMQEFQEGLGDDICQKVNPGTGQPKNQFPGLGEDKATEVISKAMNAVEEASRRYDTADSGDVSILGEKVSVGSPYSGTPETQCTDFLSPEDCNLLYNVCDPVLCPSSRCDFGGNYPVQDPAQTGIIGSIALCMPNFPQVKIPVCLTGLKAGMENLVSVFKSYNNCLEESLETGRTVGICDEIQSVYLCDLVWKEGVPLAKYGLSAAFGQSQNTGGGEYFSGGDLWQDTKETTDFLTKEYSRESSQAFQMRSTDNIGLKDYACRAFASVTYPDAGSILDTLTETRSPSQFTGKFEEMPMTTKTSPPMSHYKVTFHIYAGKDQPAHYNVYLRGRDQGSYYKEGLLGGRRQIHSDYIEAGGQASMSRDITAPSGYKELCISVNGQEECGFKQVSTSFAVNRLSDNYVEDRVTNASVTTEQECVSGKSVPSNLLNTNLQQGVSNAIDPKIYEKGITRVCSTENPGKGTDVNANAEGSRWKEVGYCGDRKVKCWIDTQSVKEAIESLDIQDRTMEELENESRDLLRQRGDYLPRQVYKKKLENISEISEVPEEEGLKRIDAISEIIDKVYYNNQKANLYYLRAQTYGSLARAIYSKISPEEEEVEEIEPEEPSIEIEQSPVISVVRGEYGFWQNAGNIFSDIFTGETIREEVTLAYFNDKWHVLWNVEEDVEGSDYKTPEEYAEALLNSDKVKAFTIKEFKQREDYEKLDSVNKEIVDSLKGRNYFKGLEELLILSQQKENIKGFDTEYAEYLAPDDLFLLTKEDEVMFLFFNEEGQESSWFWSPSLYDISFEESNEEGPVPDDRKEAVFNEAFMPVSTLKVPEGFHDDRYAGKNAGEIYGGEYERVLDNLVGISGEEVGTGVIFDVSPGVSKEEEIRGEGISGNRIWQEAKERMGSDTFRIYEGEKNYSLVCAQFVSEVLRDSGAISEKEVCVNVENLGGKLGDNEDFTEISEEEYNEGLEKGDVVLLGCSDSKCGYDSGFCKPYRHASIFDSYSGENKIRAISDPGEKKDIQYSEYSVFNDGCWHIQEVHRYKGELEDSETGASLSSVSDAIERTEELIEKPRMFKTDTYSTKGGDVKELLDNFSEKGIISDKELGWFKGESSYNDEEDLEYILEYLKMKQGINSECSSEGIDCYIELLDGRDGDYGDYLENEVLVDRIYLNEDLSNEEYEDIIGKGLFKGDKSMEEVEEILKKKKELHDENTDDLCEEKVETQDYGAFWTFLSDNSLDEEEFCEEGDIEVRNNRIIEIELRGKEITVVDTLDNLDKLERLVLPGNNIRNADLDNLKISSLNQLILDGNCLDPEKDNYDVSWFNNNVDDFRVEDNPREGCYL